MNKGRFTDTDDEKIQGEGWQAAEGEEPLFSSYRVLRALGSMKGACKAEGLWCRPEQATNRVYPHSTDAPERLHNFDPQLEAMAANHSEVNEDTEDIHPRVWGKPK